MRSQSWHFTLLGSLCARRDATVHTHFRTRQTGELLAYLATFPDKAARREELIELLWPGSEQASGRNSLRIALSFLRSLLNADDVEGANFPVKTLIADRVHVSLNSYAFTTDKSNFEAMLRKASRLEAEAEQAQALQNALSLYPGELLPDYDSHWVVGERYRLADAYLLAMRRLVTLLFKLHEFSAAFEVAHRAIQADPLREESHRMLLQLYAGTGQTSAAVRHFEVMEQQLYAELGTRPTAKTRALMAQLEPENSGASQSSSYGAGIANAAGFPFPSTPLPRSQPLRIARKGKLPLPASPFFGRQEELSAVQVMIHTPHTRLITLTGLGGSGKTRLALALAQKMQEEFDGAVWYVPLEGIQDARRILEATAQALRLPRANPLPPEEQIAQALGDSPALLILDNFEHLLPEGASALRALLDTVPDLICLVTSRQRLHLMGEYEYAVHPLPTPAAPGTPERLLEFASVQLFADRARQVRPDFAVTPRNSADVAALCHHLEGVPLALELAAAYAQTLTPGQIRAHLIPRFALLVNRHRDAPARHASLRAALDWSVHRLPNDLQAFFARCSVLRGQWSLRAAGQVCVSPTDPNLESLLPSDLRTLEALTQLRERSLLLAEEVHGEMRFRMLETVREYAAEQLSLEDTQQSRLNLSFYALDLAEEAECQLCGAQAAYWLDQLEQEHDNLRNALHFLLDAKTPIADALPHHALHLATALNHFWYVRGHYREGQEWLERSLAQCVGADASLQISAQIGLGNLALALQNLPRAQAAYDTVLALSHSIGDTRAVAIALGSQANVAKARGDLTRAQCLREQSLHRFRQFGDAASIAINLTNLANDLIALGKLAEAEAGLRESLTLFRVLQDTPNMVLCLNNLAEVALQQQNICEACTSLEESLRLAEKIQSPLGTAQALLNVSAVASIRKRERAAAELLGYVEHQLEQFQTPLGVLERACLTQEREHLTQTLGSDVFQQAWQRGKTLPLDQILCLAHDELSPAVR